MVRQLTTKAQVSGYRFLQRRTEHALVRRDVRMLHDPMRAQRTALLAGLVIGLLVLGGCGVYGLIRPQGSVGDATILIGKSSGAMFVRIDDRLHPVLNLASARLIVSSSAAPTSVAESVLADYPRGPLLGIPGAPSSLQAASGAADWTVCDTVTGRDDESTVSTTTVIGGPVGVSSTSAAVLVAGADGTYLVYRLGAGERSRAVRARIDTASVPVLRALHAEGEPVRAMSEALFNSLPRMADLAVPVIDGAGAPSALGADVLVGAVLATVDARGQRSWYAVLSDGVQRISSVVADLLVMASRVGTGAVRTVRASTIVGLPTSTRLAVAQFPSAPPQFVAAASAPVLCQHWHRTADALASTELWFGGALPLAGGQRVSVPVGADGGGPGVDQIALRSGVGEYLRVTGIESDSPRRQGRFFVSDNGTRYRIADAATGATLGLGPDATSVAPWRIIGLLAAGPPLTRAGALLAHAG